MMVGDGQEEGPDPAPAAAGVSLEERVARLESEVERLKSAVQAADSAVKPHA
jgi:hypothetical protein